MDALKYLLHLGDRRSRLNQKCRDKLIEHKLYIAEYGKDLPEIIDWKFVP